jgi:hypothetical protein
MKPLGLFICLEFSDGLTSAYENNHENGNFSVGTLEHQLSGQLISEK